MEDQCKSALKDIAVRHDISNSDVHRFLVRNDLIRCCMNGGQQYDFRQFKHACLVFKLTKHLGDSLYKNKILTVC